MSDQKISQLTNNNTIVDAQLLPVVVDPAGTPVTEKRTVGQLKTHMLTSYPRASGLVSALGNLGSTETFDWSTATNFTGNLDANITIDFSNAISGQTITLYLTYSGAQRTIAWTPTIEWGGGVAPVGPDESGEHLVVTIKYIGTTYFGSFELFK